VIRVKVRVTENNTRLAITRVEQAVDAGIANAVPGIVRLAQSNVAGYSRRIADGIEGMRMGPGVWFIVGTHHASHIAESGARHAAAYPFLVPALLASRNAVARSIEEAM